MLQSPDERLTVIREKKCTNFILLCNSCNVPDDHSLLKVNTKAYIKYIFPNGIFYVLCL